MLKAYSLLLLFYFTFRENDASYARGVLKESSYETGNRRRLVSLRMCIISWLIEILGTLCHVLFLSLVNSLGLAGIHYIEVIFMFIVIPFIYLMNDEDTKGTIANQGWYAGLKYMLGLQKVSVSSPWFMIEDNRIPIWMSQI